jgi:hypothetical protein
MSSCAADREDAIPPRLGLESWQSIAHVDHLLSAIRRSRCHRPAVSAKPVPLSQV